MIPQHICICSMLPVKCIKVESLCGSMLKKMSGISGGGAGARISPYDPTNQFGAASTSGGLGWMIWLQGGQKYGVRMIHNNVQQQEMQVRIHHCEYGYLQKAKSGFP